MVQVQAVTANQYASTRRGRRPHRQRRSALPLVPAVIDAVGDIPVVAGGIADGRGLAAVLLMGATAPG